MGATTVAELRTVFTADIRDLEIKYARVQSLYNSMSRLQSRALTPRARGGGGEAQTAAEAEQAWSRLGRAASRARSAGTLLTTFLTLPIVAAGVASIKMASDYEASIAKIEGLAGVPHVMAQNWASSMRAMAISIGRPPKELADAMFHIASEGYRGAQALGILSSAAKMAEIGMGTTADNAKALVFAVHDFAAQGLTASKAADILVATVREGNVDIGTLTNNLYKVMLPASQLGIHFKDLGAAMATLTRAGLNSATTTTSLAQFFAFLQKPSATGLKELTGHLHLTIQELRNMASKDLLATFLKLDDNARKYGANLAKVIPNIRAFRAEMGEITGKRADILSFWEAFRKSADDLGKAYKIQLATLQHTLHTTNATIQDAMISLGDALKPAAQDIASFVTTVAQWFRSLSPETKRWVAGALAAAAVVGPLLLAFSAVANTLIFLRTVFTGVQAAMVSYMSYVRASIPAIGGATTANTLQATSVTAVTAAEVRQTAAIQAKNIQAWAEAKAAQAAAAANTELASSETAVGGAATGAAGGVGIFARALGGLQAMAAATVSRLVGLLGMLARFSSVVGVMAMSAETSRKDTFSGMNAQQIRDALAKGGEGAGYSAYKSILDKQRRLYEGNAKLASTAAELRALGLPESAITQSLSRMPSDQMKRFKENLLAQPGMKELDQAYQIARQMHELDAKLKQAPTVTPGGMGAGGGGGKGKGRKGPVSDTQKALDDFPQKLYEAQKAAALAGATWHGLNTDLESTSMMYDLVNHHMDGLSPKMFAQVIALQKQKEATEAARKAQEDLSETLHKQGTGDLSIWREMVDWANRLKAAMVVESESTPERSGLWERMNALARQRVEANQQGLASPFMGLFSSIQDTFKNIVEAAQEQLSIYQDSLKGVIQEISRYNDASAQAIAKTLGLRDAEDKLSGSQKQTLANLRAYRDQLQAFHEEVQSVSRSVASIGDKALDTFYQHGARGRYVWRSVQQGFDQAGLGLFKEWMNRQVGGGIAKLFGLGKDPLPVIVQNWPNSAGGNIPFVGAGGFSGAGIGMSLLGSVLQHAAAGKGGAVLGGALGAGAGSVRTTINVHGANFSNPRQTAQQIERARAKEQDRARRRR